MAVTKMKWQELMTKILPNRIKESFVNIETLINDIKTLQDTLIGVSNINLIYKELMIMLCQDENIESAWKDLIIYSSSYKVNDCRFVMDLFQRVIEYAGFYKKILTDEGIQRHLVYDKEYNNSGSASSVERGTDSVTPNNSALYSPVESTANRLFDEAIANYASGLNKNKSSSESSSLGTSKTKVTGTTWEEEKKNMQMLFYNELCSYLGTIPEKIYAYYSLDTMPVPELARKFFEYIDETIKLLTDYE